ncbi:hypothetical protein GCM10022271_20730 [Corallibacter vietnamensis]|uniref:DUF4468 domain-containing protein n=1 Tax=Corallibacter vietnamensis TaxID=904130 RepID=A0ABP7HFQ2_9FLAO
MFYLGGWILAPGSYPRAETYEINLPEDSLIQIINQIKLENPELSLSKKVKTPNSGNFSLLDGRKDENGYWYSIYFYYENKNQIIHTWTRPKNENSTTFAFVGINNGLTLGNWKTVNESFWWWKNKPEIEEFEARIFRLINEKIKTKHNKG